MYTEETLDDFVLREYGFEKVIDQDAALLRSSAAFLLLLHEQRGGGFMPFIIA